MAGSPDLEAVRNELYDLAQRCYKEGLVRLSEGNFSLRSGPDGPVAITPSGVPYDGMTPDDIIFVAPDGTVVEGRHRPSSETPMHTGILRARPDVSCVVHTHSPYAVAFAVLGREIPPVSAEALAVGMQGIPVAEFALPGSAGMVAPALEALERKRAKACLLQNHGVVAVGKTAKEALSIAVYTETAAQAYHMALAVGEPVVLTSETLKAAMARARGIPGPQ